MVDPVPTSVLRDRIERMIAVLLLVVATPLMVFISLAIVLVDRQIPIYRQWRYGLAGRRFRIFKFTTMRPGSEKEGFTTRPADPRITAMGKYLRKLRLNELPQILNVIRGDIALIGPRALPLHTVDQLPTRLRDSLLAVVPGATGAATIAFRGEDNLLHMFATRDEREWFYTNKLFPAKVAVEREYASFRTLKTDLRLLYATARLALGFDSKSTDRWLRTVCPTAGRIDELTLDSPLPIEHEPEPAN